MPRARPARTGDGFFIVPQAEGKVNLMRSTSTAALLFLSFASAAPSVFAQSFMGLGDLPGGDFFSFANGISGDGRAVTGQSHTVGDATEAFLWKEGTGIVGLGVPNGSVSSLSAATNQDGSVVVGLHGMDAPGFPTRAFQWTTGGGATDFNPFPVGSYNRFANDLSADGGVIVGEFQPAQNQLNLAYHWSGGSFTEIEDPNLDDGTNATAVSADGSVVAGAAQILNFPNPVVREAFVWTAAGGITRIGFLPGATNGSSASGISADGNTAVGTSESSNGDNEAFRWTETGGMVGLGDLPGGDFASFASDTTANGSIVVGRSDVLGGQFSSSFDPFIWDDTHGMRNLVDVLTNDFDLSAELVGWDLIEATAISDDGRVIVGNGTNPDGNFEAWIARIPEPSTALLGVLMGLGLHFGRGRCPLSKTA